MSGQLPQKFKAGPWYHEQVVREGHVAIYRRWKLYDGQEGALHYEVIRIAFQEARMDAHGISHVAKEVYPVPGSWGSRGWTFKTLPEAQAKYTSLLDAASSRAAD